MVTETCLGEETHRYARVPGFGLLAGGERHSLSVAVAEPVLRPTGGDVGTRPGPAPRGGGCSPPPAPRTPRRCAAGSCASALPQPRSHDPRPPGRDAG